MPSLCHNLSSHYAHLRTLTAEFTTAYEQVKDSGDLREVRKLKKKLEVARDSLLEQLCIFRVPDAINPYHEAMLAAGLDATKTQEKQDMILDIREEIQRQLAHYRTVIDSDNAPVLQDWIDDITQNKGLLYAEVTNDRSSIEARIKAGMIPIVMPSRRVQEETRKSTLSLLKPIWINHCMEVTVNKTSLTDQYELGGLIQPDIFKNIPDRPYLLWTKPTQGHDPVTINKSLADQRATYASLVRDHPHLYDQIDIIPTEYLALQSIITSFIRDRYQQFKGITNKPYEVLPLDFRSITRFLSEVSFVIRELQYVPYAGFDEDDYNRVECFWGDEEVGNRWGFRPASRT